MSELPKLKSKQQQAILEKIRQFSVIRTRPTSGEVIASISEATNINAWRARFSELRDRGMIMEAGERRCKISGRLSLIWAPTTRTLPLPSKRKRHDRPTIKAHEWHDVARRLVNELCDLNAKSPAVAAYNKLAGRV